jgi:CheY-like chemotaxis protein
MKILLVDDDAFLRDMYVTKFTACGHEITAVQDAAEALRLLEANTDFDVILTDMIMPGMSGIDFLTKAKDHLAKNNIKAIMLTNQNQDEDISEAKEAGVIGYLVKAHLIPSEVVEKVEAIMAKQS